MAKQEFLRNLRVARNLFAHPRVFTDSQHIDPSATERMIERAAIWLTPRSVRGFAPEDFTELGTDRRQQLANSVAEFEDVAQTLSPKEAASRDQLSKGGAAL